MITQGEKGQIKAILQSPQWQTVERIFQDLCDRIAYEPVVRETEWDTLKTSLINEGKVRGIKDLLKELYNLAQSLQ